MAVTVFQRIASTQQISLLLVPAIKGAVYINLACHHSFSNSYVTSDVNNDLTFKAKDKDKDQTLKAKDQDKDQTYKDKDQDQDQTPKDKDEDKDQTFKAKDQDKD